MPRAVLCLDCGRPYWPHRKGRCPECQAKVDRADYYQGDEWKRIRAEARRRGGDECAVCGARGVRLITHHKKPRKEGGADTQDNLLLLCGEGAVGMPWDSCHSQLEADRRLGKDTELRRLVEAL
jgi:5-methylcytosine-specific restriction endonuclease McrA